MKIQGIRIIKLKNWWVIKSYKYVNNFPTIICYQIICNINLISINSQNSYSKIMFHIINKPNINNSNILANLKIIATISKAVLKIKKFNNNNNNNRTLHAIKGQIAQNLKR